MHLEYLWMTQTERCTQEDWNRIQNGQIGQMAWGQQDEMPQRQVIYFEGKKASVTYEKGNQMASIMLGV